MHFANKLPLGASPRQAISPMKTPTRPPRLYSPQRNQKSPVFVRIQQPMIDALPVVAQQDSRPVRAASVGLDDAHASPQLRMRSTSVVSPALSPDTPKDHANRLPGPQDQMPERSVAGAMPPDARHRNVTRSLESSPLAGAPPSLRQSWLNDAKPLKRVPHVSEETTTESSIRKFLADVPSSPAARNSSPTAIASAAPADVRQQLQLSSPPPYRLPFVGGSLAGEVLREVEFAERHRRQSIIERHLGEAQELRLQYMIERNAVQQKQHRTHRTHQDFVEAYRKRHFPQNMDKQHNDETFANEQHSSHPTDITPEKQIGTSAASTSGTASRQTPSSSSLSLLQRASPRVVASVNAFEALKRVMFEEERSSRSLIEASFTNACVFVRQFRQCWQMGLHPQTIYVQEQHGFNTIRALYEEKQSVLLEQHQRWLWERHAERVQFWVKRVSGVMADENDARDAIASDQQRERNDMLKTFQNGSRLILDDLQEERARNDSKWRRTIVALMSLEAMKRGDVQFEQAQVRRTLADAEDEDFRVVLDRTTFANSCFLQEALQRNEIEDEEQKRYRDIGQNWKGGIAAMQTERVTPHRIRKRTDVNLSGSGGDASKHHSVEHPSQQQDHSPLAESSVHSDGDQSQVVAVSLNDSGYLRLVDEDREQFSTQRADRKKIASPIKRRSTSVTTTQTSAGEAFMRPTTSSQRKATPPPSAAHGMLESDYASSVPAPSSVFDSDRESASAVVNAVRVVTPLHMQRTIDRLSQPKRVVTHIPDSHVISSQLDSVSEPHDSVDFGMKTVHPMRGSNVVWQLNQDNNNSTRGSLTRNERAASARRTASSKAEPMSAPTAKMLSGNSVVILRDSSRNSQAQQRSTSVLSSNNNSNHSYSGSAVQRTSNTSSSRTTSPAVIRAQDPSKTSKRYVDMFFRASSDADVATTRSETSLRQPSLLQSFNGNSAGAVSFDADHDHSAGLPPRTSHKTAAAASSLSSKLSRWEEATVKMYEQQKRRH